MMEAAFKDETVGLVTREEFLSKKNTLQERMDEAKAQARRYAERAAEQVARWLLHVILPCTPWPLPQCFILEVFLQGLFQGHCSLRGGCNSA